MKVFPKGFPTLLVILPINLAAYFPLDDIKVCMSHKLDAKCSGYAYKKIKPLLDYFAPINSEIEKRDKEIASLKELIRTDMIIISELNEKLKIKKLKQSKLTSTKEIIVIESDESNQNLDSLKSQLADQNIKILDLQSQIQSCQDNGTNIDIEINNLKSKIKKFKAHKYLPNGCDAMGNFTGFHAMHINIWPFLVSCDSEVAGPGWTVVQRRIDDSSNFYQNWTKYKWGFGTNKKGFFLGLQKLHKLTNTQRYELNIILYDQNWSNRTARYDNFVIGSEAEKYMLKSLGKYTGNAGDSMRYHEEAYFTTYDRHNDNYEGNCAKTLMGGWWFFNCAYSNLNGKRFDCSIENSNVLAETGCIYWQHWYGRSYSMRKVQMMIRPYAYNFNKN